MEKKSSADKNPKKNLRDILVLSGLALPLIFYAILYFSHPRKWKPIRMQYRLSKAWEKVNIFSPTIKNLIDNSPRAFTKAKLQNLKTALL